MTRFDKLSISLRYYLLGRGYFGALKAWDFAQSLHSGFRKDGVTPEFQHQIEIVHYLRTMPNIPEPELIYTIALLHDTAEDKDVSFDEIAAKFGQEVACHVQTLSKVYRGSMQIDTKTYYGQIAKHPFTAIVKGADRIHNIGSMVGVFTPQKQLMYVEETLHYVVPMLKTARRSFPEYEAIFENMKHHLNSQLTLIRKINDQDIK